MKKLRIKNFLAIKDATVEFDENGVYHIKGRNNVGKSALLKAINTLFNNVSQQEIKEFLRDGQSTFLLDSEMHDGSTVKLSRGATDYYAWNVNGVEGRLDKTKGKVPDALVRYYNLYTDTERTNECLNVRLPRDVLTFVDTSKMDSYYLVQKALRTEEYVLASQKVNAKKREITSSQKQIKEFITRDTKRITQTEAQLVELKTQQALMEQEMATLEQEYTIFMEIQSIAQTAQQISECDAQIRAITNGIDIERGEQLKQEIEEFELIQEVLNMLIEAGTRKNQIIQLRTEIDNASELRQMIQDLEEIVEMRQLTQNFVLSVNAVKEKKIEVEQAQKAHMDFMVENKFCPIVMNTLDQRCPFSVNVGGAV